MACNVLNIIKLRSFFKFTTENYIQVKINSSNHDCKAKKKL